ncbi:MAG: DUF4293 family protein, partial [Bacteroidia bacterium]
MIQRVQSLFLAVVVLCGVSFLIYPYANSLPITETSNITLMPTRASGFNTIFYIGVILNMISIVGTFITIFLFKNRKLQIKLIFLLIIVNFLLLGALYISNSNAQNN